MGQQTKLTIPQMLAKLDSMYVEEEQLKKNMIQLQLRYKQLQDDKEMLQNMIMYTSNKINRGIK